MNLGLIVLALIIVGNVESNPVGLVHDRQKRSVLVTTDERVTSYNYPVEKHTVQTQDGYILTMFRIPFSPKLQNQYTRKPVVFLQHGVISSSDCWILNGPENALAFLLADAGYDVWMGNARGNNYSKKHVKIPWLLPIFWDFSWHEIGVYDLPAMIDYTLYHTGEKGLHYVGHSQGTTVLFVLLSSIPRYNGKIKTAHLLSPVAFVGNITSPTIKILANALGHPSFLIEIIGSNQFMPSNKYLGMLGSKLCSEYSKYQEVCANIIFILAGWDSEHFNYTLLPAIAETHPAGSSSMQIIHYLQEYLSGHFRRFDYGSVKNYFKYGQLTPPDYIIKNIVAPLWFYHGDNDKLSPSKDVRRLENLLPNLKDNFRVPYKEWNHLDYLWALEVKEMLYDKIINVVNHYEQTGMP